MTVTRRLRGAALVAAMTALPRFAQAATGAEEHMYEVVAAFGVLVAAATAASIVVARRQRRAARAASSGSVGGPAPSAPAKTLRDRRATQCNA